MSPIQPEVTGARSVSGPERSFSLGTQTVIRGGFRAQPAGVANYLMLLAIRTLPDTGVFSVAYTPTPFYLRVSDNSTVLFSDIHYKHASSALYSGAPPSNGELIEGVVTYLKNGPNWDVTNEVVRNGVTVYSHTKTGIAISPPPAHWPESPGCSDYAELSVVEILYPGPRPPTTIDFGIRDLSMVYS